jgi:hypothetical protein
MIAHTCNAKKIPVLPRKKMSKKYEIHIKSIEIVLVGQGQHVQLKVIGLKK